MDIRVLATVLLIGHLISAVFMAIVLVRQVRLFRLRAQDGLVWFRRILFVLALGIFFGNFIPIFIDALTIFNIVTRSTNRVNTIGIAYSVSNALVFALSALLIWILYRMAATTILIVEHDKEVALEDVANNQQSGVQ